MSKRFDDDITENLADYEFIRRGRDLSEEEVELLEKSVSSNPTDFESRLKLMGFYVHKHQTSSLYYFEHAIWFIDNCFWQTKSVPVWQEWQPKSLPLVSRNI